MPTIETENDLVSYFEPKVKQYARYWSRRIKSSPEDVEQELYIVLLRAYRTYGHKYDTKFDNYFTRSIKNYFINHLGKKQRRGKHAETVSLDQLQDDHGYLDWGAAAPCIPDLDSEAQILTGMTVDQLVNLPPKQLKELAAKIQEPKEPVKLDLIIKVVNEFLEGKTYTQLYKQYNCKGLTNPRMINHWIKRLVEKGIITKEQVDERMSTKSNRIRHTVEQKRAIVMEYLMSTSSAKDVASKHNINPTQIFIWKKALGITQEKVTEQAS